eukprot:Protomagalhaensia_sp_Gyna_25__3438@NODE_30_length_7280_cov_84_840492_g20_i0_p9_GENE_NODE_30_length_7280_cov_84_840492_g20_i0NODE_30_length_7280_cov_84_840492_g20_i0_p9_ORF_typecomplete_len120_score22_72Shisa/PF13908_6/0_0045Ost5/PF05251_12/0_049L6_membrane/PF05805_12/0_048DUF2970/PF11174_8/0_44DUF2970/PF11174_8/4_3e02DUF4577/PF15145_6/0_073TMEM154/PF15102_6/0_11EVC2_like/PF12297_8/12EVC2_like/PF12297_8/1_1TMEM132D_C/PF15706_5/0_44UL42/PF17638_2/0_53UL42/PF17638_2/1e03DUF2937/PF11157_8/0_76DUF293
MGNQASTIANYNQQRLTTMAYVLVGVVGAVFLGFMVAFLVSAMGKSHAEKIEARARMEGERNHANHQTDMMMLEVLNRNRQSPPHQQQMVPVQPPVQQLPTQQVAMVAAQPVYVYPAVQ